MKIIAAQEHQSPAEGQQTIIAPANDADPFTLDLTGVQRIDLHFPKFTDGRAYTQATLLHRRYRFKGSICATGDVLIDQLVHMYRSGFTHAVLAEGVNADAAQRQFDRFTAFYQGDVLEQRPLFARLAAQEVA